MPRTCGEEVQMMLDMIRDSKKRTTKLKSAPFHELESRIDDISEFADELEFQYRQVVDNCCMRNIEQKKYKIHPKHDDGVIEI